MGKRQEKQIKVSQIWERLKQMRTETKAKAAILNSYTELVAYKDYILFQGRVIVHWKETAKTS